MKTDIDNDTLMFSSGHSEYAHHCRVGLAEPEDGVWRVTAGEDHDLHIHGTHIVDRIELCDYMIGLWSKFKISLKKEAQ